MALDLDYKTKSKTMIIWSWIHFFTVFCRTQGPRRIMKIWPWTLIQGPRLWKYDLGLWLEAVIHIFMATCRSQGPKLTMNILSWTLHQILGLRPYFWGLGLGPQVWQDHDNMVLDSALSLNLRPMFHGLGLAPWVYDHIFEVLVLGLKSDKTMIVVWDSALRLNMRLYFLGLAPWV